MDRLAKFESLALHPWLGRLYAKLSAPELEMAKQFIISNSGLDAGAFESAVCRMFLDRTKPRHYAAITELLSCCNSLR